MRIERLCAAGELCSHLAANPPLTASFGTFDSFVDAVLVLLQMMTFNEWHTPLYAIIAASPRRGHK